MILQENTVVADRFRLVKMIGRGGMGSVWQAQHLGLDTACAVKFIEGELANVAEAHSRFEREARAAAQLRSPHVVQIMDHGVWQGMPYIAMELLEGEDLGKRLTARGGLLSPPEVNTVVQQVCRALSKAHGAGIVHRDLKPDNIFLVRDDDRELVKILDFGVAKQASHMIDGSNTKTGAMLGTPYYMSPEQAQGIKSVDARSDLWSLAVIVFQCITGRLPFESEALGDLLVKIIVNPIPRPSDLASVPSGFDAWWFKAADRNVENRFPTAKAFAESLQLALGQSSMTEVTDRNRLLKMGGATAMMPNAPTGQVGSNVANTPFPGQQPAAHMQTPRPYSDSQPGMPAAQPMGYPGSHPNASTGNPTGATFSGVEPPVMLPKKGPPIALLAGVGALAVVGLTLGGVAIMKGRGGHDTTGGTSGASSVVSTATATASATDTLPAVATATPTVAATATTTAAANAVPSATAAVTAAAAIPAPLTTAATGHHPGIVKPLPTTKPTASPVAAATTPPPAGSVKKPALNLGF